MCTAALPDQFLSTDRQNAPAVSCNVVTGGLSFVGKMVALRNNRLRVILPTPLFARPDATTLILTNLDGVSLNIAGCVMSQRQIGGGEMMTVIQLANLPSESAMTPHEQRMIASLRHIHRTPGRSPWAGQCVDWAHDLAGYMLAPFQDRRIIPRLAIHTNGPGTGKTTIINALMKIYREIGAKIFLAAPTGRASKRMSEATGYPARTIHRMLEFNPQKLGFQRDERHPLDADVLVLDETSMVDTILMYHLLKAVPSEATLIMVGDVNQLPSVGRKRAEGYHCLRKDPCG